MSFPDSYEEFSNPKQYKGRGRKINKLRSKIEFDLYGDEVAICQSILRTSDYGVIQVKADGMVIGTFTNHNPTLGREKEEFTATGSSGKFLLKHPYTYDHKISINGRLLSGKIYDGDYGGSMPEGIDYLVIRKFNQDHKPVHAVWFRNTPTKGDRITVNYNFGRVIMFEGSTVGQTTSDEVNESNYGDGTSAVSSRIASGMELRYIDRNAFWIHQFTTNKDRHFEIEIIDGVNPYFIINYASNRYHDYMNAGIGGWMLKGLLDDDGINDFTGFFDHFLPDIIINESATNDDWEFGERKLKRSLDGLSEEQVKKLWTLELDQVRYNKKTRDYSVRFTTGLISEIDRFSLASPQIIGSGVNPGDIIRIGDYHGDNRQVACREIATVDHYLGKVSWLEPLNPELILNTGSLDDLIGKECSVRDLSGYRYRYQVLIENLRRIAPHAQILVTQPGLSNCWTRQLWGYDIIHRNLAAMYPGVGTIEITERLKDFVENNISGNSFTLIEADGSREYTLPWKGHWQGFEVWFNNRNIYGKDCYIEGGKGYAVNQSASVEDLNTDKTYDKSYSADRAMRLVFTGNIPKNGQIRINKADYDWSGDHCHPNTHGTYIYGRTYINRLKDLMH